MKMFNYQIFPFATEVQPGFETLPVEMTSYILRFLDDASLLSAARTSRKWMSICRGDPVLRRRVRGQLKEMLEWRKQAILNPRMAVTVTRQQTKLFNANVEKTVSRNQEFLRQRQMYEESRPVASVFSIREKYASQNGGGKMKRGRDVGNKPYRSLRM